MTLRLAGTRTVVRLSAEIIGRLVQLGILIALARTYSQADFGTLVVGATAGLVLAQVSDIGLSLVVGADVARRLPSARRGISSALGVKAVLLAAIWLGPLAGLLLIEFSPVQVGAMLIAGALAIESIVLFTSAMFRAIGAFRFDWTITLAPRVLAGLIVVPVVLLGGGPIAAGLAWTAAALAAAVVAITMLNAAMPLTRPAARAMRDLVGRSWPVGATIVLGMLYTRVGIFLLPTMVAPEQVAVYAVAYNVVERTYLLPNALAAVFYPAYAGSMTNSIAAASLLWRWAIIVGAIGVAVYAVFVVAGVPIVVLLFGQDFALSGELLILLGLVVVPGFVSFLLNQALIARGLGRFNMTVSGLLLALSVIGNLALIPHYSYWGTAAVAVAVEILLLALFGWRLGSARMTWRAAR